MTKPQRKIDAHHHLWTYTPAEFGWIDDRMEALRRDFEVDELTREADGVGVCGTVAVQARQTLEETRFLCGVAQCSSIMRGVVGWAPIADEGFPKIFEQMRTLPHLVGLRHVVQAEPDGFLDGRAFNAGLRHLTAVGLTYDLLVFERQLEEAIRFVDRHPKQAFVLDHVAKPRIAEGVLEPWRAHMRELARRPNVMCKISGMVTEAKWSQWALDTLRPYVDVCMESFGPARLMAGSDWPVCLLASSYQRWWETLEQYFRSFSDAERDAIFATNAISFYRLEDQKRAA
ncbi:MAG TPA: amidohydrolase family protein [Acidobacteriaceae bacterium]|jgi:L-fuconolactonase|nr:amidohydrolase family protein [Acidobacteriaceae bacterium]